MKAKLFHSGNLIIIGFILCAASMLYLAYLTTTVNFDMSVTGDYYAIEKEVNEIHTAKRNSAALGKSFTIYEKDDTILISIPPRISSKITNGMVKFYCISDSNEDTNATIYSSPDGLYSFDKKKYMRGNNYKVKVTFEADGIKYYKEILL